MKRVAFFCLAAGLLLAGDRGGLRPRAKAGDYPGHDKGKGAEVGAAAVPREQVAKLFATDLNRGGYVVVEVAVYPEAGSEADLQAGDFLLSAAADPATVRAVSAQAVAAALQRKNTPKHHSPGDVAIFPTATVGYESGSYGNGQRRSGVYTAAGVGGVGDPGPMPPAPGSTAVDRSTMQQELQDKGLPEVKTSDPVAGYLYFPRPASAKGANPTYRLTYYGAEGQVIVTIPPPAKK